MPVTTLSALRADIADRLTDAGIPTKSYVPERVVTPAAVVLPDTPYLDGTETGELSTMCGEWTARYRVILIGSRGTNQQSADELDALIVAAAGVLDGPAYSLETVEEPAEVEINGASYLGTVLIISAPTTLEEIEA